MKNLIYILILITLISCTDNDDNPSNPSEFDYDNIAIDSLHTHLGIPIDNDLSDDYYVQREEYFVSYNNILNTPNYVCWNLNIDWFGEAERFEGNWKFDPLLPSSFDVINHSTFTNSGYDRGHIVRSEERTRNDEDNENTFYNTNLMPQTADLNRGVWLDFEYYCEDLVKEQNKELYIVSGSIFTSNTTINGITHVPDSCWKVVVVLERKEGIVHVTENTQVIAVNMPNIDGIRSDDWTKYQTTVDAIEESTGYDLLHLIPDEIENRIE